MNISYNWLKDLIDIDLSVDDLAVQLTRVGFAVEGTHPHADDFVLDIDLTSNRPDCLSHLGIAREIAAITRSDLKTSDGIGESEPEIPLPAVLAYDVVAIQDADLCHRFTARLIKNVNVGSSPEWLVKRLEAIGERSISNVADITNYVMHELGQPMHSFDYEKLAGNRLVVRRAKAGETITTLDEVDRKLDETMLAICDAERPVAVGGVMGGLDSSITNSTTTVLLEVAYFDRASIRQTSRKLELSTEASVRFERGVDIDNLTNASNRAAELICELAGGELGTFIDVYPTQAERKKVRSQNIAFAVERLSGLKVSADRSIEILSSVGIDHEENDPATFISPSWRHDIVIEEDLVEEVARHVGYENIADELPPAYGAGEYQQNESRKKRLRRVLVDLGFNEAVSYSFIDTRHDGRFETVPGMLDDRSEEELVKLRDSVIEGAVRMRPTLLPGLLDAVRLNMNHQRRDLRLFEVGKCFAARETEDGLPAELELLSLVVTGGSVRAKRAMTDRDLDFYDAKGAVEAALDAIGFGTPEFKAADGSRHLRAGQSAQITVAGTAVGTLGRLNEELTSDYKFKQPVYVAELDLQAILAQEIPPVLYRSLPKYPAVVRDVSFVVTREISFDQIKSAIVGERRELCRSVGFVDVYEGKGMGQNERSLTIRLEYRSDERTLLDSEVDEDHTQLIETVERELNIRRRI
ncbi:MAG: phenylalanine--tRNA ligase subunit beta [Solirubrobacterales bacterium]|nr:phenylalanine--tRNA ligase subunit beta [Solirubrobacterales bacterium]